MSFTRPGWRIRTLPYLRIVVYLIVLILLGLSIAGGVYFVSGSTFREEPSKLVFRVLEVMGILTCAGWLWLQGNQIVAAWALAASPRTWLWHVLLGWLAGVAMLALIAWALTALGARELTGSLTDLPGLLARGLVVGLAVSVLEEIWFRGGLLTALAAPSFARRGSAVVISSLLFSAVHFIRPEAITSQEAASWLVTWHVFASSFGRFLDPMIVGPALALFCAGMILALVRVRTGCIAGCIGLHAGWVSVIYTFKRVSEPQGDAPGAMWAAGYDGVIGWLAAAVFLGVLLVLHRRRLPGQ